MQLPEVDGSRDSRPAGCRFDSYAAHYSRRSQSCRPPAGTLARDRTTGLVSGNLERLVQRSVGPPPGAALEAALETNLQRGLAKNATS